MNKQTDNGEVDNNKAVSEETLNLFIDEQLDKAEMDEIRQRLLDDKGLRERVCQLKAVQELIGYAYSDVPRSRVDRRFNRSLLWKRVSSAIAASIILIFGALIGWFGHGSGVQQSGIATSSEIFQYFANNVPTIHNARKIVIHVASGGVLTLKKAMDETEQLIRSYRVAGTPLSIDIVANKAGINLLRKDVSPYSSRIEKIIRENKDIHFYACARSIAKARKREGHDIVMLPEVNTAKTARDIIPELIDKGWVYIKV